MAKKKAGKKDFDQTAEMLRHFSEFLEEIEGYRTSSIYSKELVKSIFETWSETAKTEKKYKHQAAIIKGFAVFLS